MTQTARTLIVELGQALGLESLLDEDAELAVLDLEDTPTLSVSIDDDQCMVFCANLGAAPEGQPELVEELLASNLFWRDTGGATLSMDRYTRSIFLARRWSAREFDDVPSFIGAVEQFVQLAAKWSVVLAEMTSVEFETTEASKTRMDPSLLRG